MLDLITIRSTLNPAKSTVNIIHEEDIITIAMAILIELNASTKAVRPVNNAILSSIKHDKPFNNVEIDAIQAAALHLHCHFLLFLLKRGNSVLVSECRGMPSIRAGKKEQCWR